MAKNKKLDCNTPQGKKYIADQTVCQGRIEKTWNDTRLFPTKHDEDADIDAVAVHKGVISAVMEIKSREMSMAELRSFGSYLVTFEKLLKIREMSRAFVVPGFLFVYLLKDGVIVYWKISDDEGNLLPTVECRVSRTQATCNGGEADRYNAYLNLKQMKTL